MSALDTAAAIDRVIARRKELGGEDFAAYAVLVLGILADHAPEVVTFCLDRADALLSPDTAADRSET